MTVCVCILAHGAPNYLAAAKRALRSVLIYTDFDIYLQHDASGPALFAGEPRVRAQHVASLPEETHRAHRFLCKLRALRAALDSGAHDWLVHLDADAILLRGMTVYDLEAAVGDLEMGMVEQTGITGSSMDRADFLDHYTKYTLGVLDPRQPPPDIGAFRFFNSGVVIARRAHWARFLTWSLNRIEAHNGAFERGGHMVADQDFFQYWANTEHPGHCAELSWHWNHCEFWDDSFPRAGARIAHFSNFCNGPTKETLNRMDQLLRPGRRALRGLGHLTARGG